MSSSLFASRWADTPPPEGQLEKQHAQSDADAGDRAGNLGVGSVQKPDIASPPQEVNDGLEAEAKLDSAGKTLEENGGAEGVINPPEGEAKAEDQEDVLGQNDDKGRSNEAAPTTTPLPAEPPRFKKRLTWRGKTCMISIPYVDFEALGFPKPLSSEEVSERIKAFEDAGFDTHGFDLPDDVEKGLLTSPHVRPIYPDESEFAVEASQQAPRVSLPDLAKWSAYMDELTEKKLAALGVSTGLSDPAPAPVAQDMSRQSSGQYPPLPFSPPIPATSAGSVGRPGMLRGHSHTMSVASPLSPGAGPFGHMHRHSTFTGPFGFGQQPAPQVHGPPIPGMQPYSPQQQFGMPAFPRGGSPAQFPGLRQDLSAARGPGSPLGQQPFPQSPQEYSRNLMEDQRRRQHSYSQSMQQPQSMPHAFMPQSGSVLQTPALPELPEEDDEEELQERVEPEEPKPEETESEVKQADPPAYVPPHKRAHFNAEIATPTPRGHRHNISEGLERDILEAEKRHEAARSNWIEVDEEADDSKAEKASKKFAKPEASAERDPLAADYPVQEAVRSHKKSASRLNVAAPSFTFNPAASFKPAAPAFTFGASAPRGQPAGRPEGHSRQVSSGSFNVAAAPFKPAHGPSVPTTEFSFSAEGPKSQPPASALPSKPAVDRTIVDDLPSIFGKVTIPDIVKPSKRSKAVAIVRPEETKSAGSDTDVEDEDGRIIQSDDRLKRQRKVDDDGDEVPQFAEPLPMPNPFDFASKVHDRHDVVEDVTEPDKLGQAVVTDAEPVRDTAPRNENVDAAEKPKAHGHKSSASLSALAKPFVPPYPTGDPKVEDWEPVDSSKELEEGEIDEGSESDKEDFESEDRVPAFPDPPMSFLQPLNDRVAQIAPPEPSFDEIDAVMRQLNDGQEATPREEAEKQEETAMSPLPSLDEPPMTGVTYLPEWTRSDAPSPSPTRQKAQYNALADSSFTIHERTDSGEQVVQEWPHVNRLNKADDIPPSDWSDMLSPPDQDKLIQRSNFFDSHIDEVIGRVVERRLLPLEEALRSIQTVVSKRARSVDQPPLKRSSSAVESDADDEDELSEAQQQRPISRGRDKRVDQIKIAVLEALREQSPKRSQSAYDIADLHSALADMKVSFARAASASLELEDVRAVVEEALSRQGQAVVPMAIDEGTGYHKRELSELEGRLNETLAGVLEEANHRRAVEEREAETRRLLRLAEEELDLLRDTSHDEETRLNLLEHERDESLDRVQQAEQARRRLEEQVKELEAENAAMQGTLDEYRMSSSKWRLSIDEGKREREDLEDTIADLERQVDESHESSSSMRRRLEKLHTDMASAAGQLVSEQTKWKAKEEEYRSRCDTLEHQDAVHSQQRAQMEEELRSLRAVASDSANLKTAQDHMRESNTSLEELVRKLQTELAEQHAQVATHKRDLLEVKEAGSVEIHHMRLSAETELAGANHQSNVLRLGLETELSKVRAELETAKAEVEASKARHTRVLEDEKTARTEAIERISETSRVAIDETRQKHDSHLTDLATQHSRALRFAQEDKERSEMFFHERLALSDAKLQHSQDRIAHLEERLEVAKSAAQAAAASAQTRGFPGLAAPTSLPEKVSPQALRESILVLQEQLGEREAHIERLQNQIENEAAAKTKERDAEVAWLRELLGVRSEELTDLVNTLSQPSFDRDAVRDNAIRIRANLQMQQQEKERFGYAPHSLGGQALASLSSFATPKASQLTSAFNKWRANMENSALRNAPRSAGIQRASTPSKPRPSAIPHGYSEGLMTPPASNLRSTPSPEATSSLALPRLRSSDGVKSAPTKLSAGLDAPRSRAASAASDAPTTPLFREQSYDRDAEDHPQEFDDDDLDVADSAPPAFRSLEAELEPSAGPGAEVA